jgi:hypothetical protein
VLIVVAFIDPFLVMTLEDKKACIGLSEKWFDFTVRLAVVFLNLKLVNSVILLSMIVK